MKPIADARMDEFEALAMESVKQIRAYFAYQGSDAKPGKKARIACAAVSAYARLRSSETNRMALELANDRLIHGAPETRRALKAAR